MKPRCACRPACLSRLQTDDVTVATADGLALAEHLNPVSAYPDEGLTSLASPLSKVHAQ